MEKLPTELYENVFSHINDEKKRNELRGINYSASNVKNTISTKKSLSEIIEQKVEKKFYFEHIDVINYEYDEFLEDIQKLTIIKIKKLNFLSCTFDFLNLMEIPNLKPKEILFYNCCVMNISVRDDPKIISLQSYINKNNFNFASHNEISFNDLETYGKEIKGNIYKMTLHGEEPYDLSMYQLKVLTIVDGNNPIFNYPAHIPSSLEVYDCCTSSIPNMHHTNLKQLKVTTDAQNINYLARNIILYCPPTLSSIYLYPFNDAKNQELKSKLLQAFPNIQVT
jgi:hypothetical protein